MKLPTVNFKPSAFVINEQAKVNLIALYLEMLSVHNKEVMFDQDDCDHCVIGNAIRDGIFNVDKHPDDLGAFNQAIDMIGFEDNEDGDIREFLFMSESTVGSAGDRLQLPTTVEGKWDEGGPMSPLDACVRIAALLDRAGYDYDVKQLPDVPGVK